jgi:pre-mRNA-splicing factor ISY1
MARNEEKAMTALNRWTAQKRDLERSVDFMAKGTYMGGALPDQAQFGPYASRKRPKIASEVSTVKECEHWRSSLLQGVSKKIATIQDASLGEHRIRDLNDEINKDLREKKYWEEHIKKLGGVDYQASKVDAEATYGAELASHTGYKYFGAAKDLPGVREIFEAEHIPEAPRKTRKQLFKNIQPDYYGWRDEEDGMLVLAEQEFEHGAVLKEIARWKREDASKPKAKKAKTDMPEASPEKTPLATATPVPKENVVTPAAKVADDQKKVGADFKAYVDVPEFADIERMLLAKKKQTLLAKYTSDEMRKQASESKELISG